MIKIEEDKSLYFQNLLQFRKILHQSKIGDYITKMEEYISEKEKNFLGIRIESFHNNPLLDKNSGVDFECLMVIDGEIISTEDFIYKKEIKIENALYGFHEGTILSADKSRIKLLNYMREKRLTPSTDLFTVFSNLKDGQSIDEINVEYYIGIKK
ncbi:MAG: hypothetical protein JXR70_11035 [Spirochaetales bacterium]|nr:hypothetical protein [Spirochaetales bacterium]